MLDALLLPPAFAAINRARGGGLWADRLPGHPRFWMAIVAGLVSVPVAGFPGEFYVAACFLFWAWLPWGRWYDLGRLSDTWVTRRPSWFEKRVSAWAEDDDHIAFTIRNTIGALPAIVLIGPLFLALAPSQTLAYELGWRLTPQTPIRTGEIITGALWGLFIACTYSGPVSWL